MRYELKNVKIKLFVLLLLLPVIIYLWPAQIYGNTSYIMLLGNSMSPTIESGTFVIVKSEQDYSLGDIIAFINEDSRNVVHRIVDKTDTGYVTKGDNNPKDDPGIVKTENVVGKTIFIIPYVGFTSLFLQTPIGISIFGIWALVMFTKNRSKKKKNEGQESFIIFKIGLIAIIVNYTITQIALAINQEVSKIINIPFSNYFEPTTANTISFGVLMIAIFTLYYFMYSIKNKKTDEIKPLKVIFSLGGIMILIIQCMNIMNIIPFFMNTINEQNITLPVI